MPSMYNVLHGTQKCISVRKEIYTMFEKKKGQFLPTGFESENYTTCSVRRETIYILFTFYCVCNILQWARQYSSWTAREQKLNGKDGFFLAVMARLSLYAHRFIPFSEQNYANGQRMDTRYIQNTERSYVAYSMLSFTDRANWKISYKMWLNTKPRYI